MLESKYLTIFKDRIRKYAYVKYFTFIVLIANVIIGLSLRLYNIDIWARFTYDEALMFEVANYINENGIYGCYTL